MNGDLVWTGTYVSSWTQATVDLSSYSGTCTLKLGAWVTGSISGVFGGRCFDNLHLYGFPPPVMDAEPATTPGTSNEG